jgi:DNA polymerase III subunit chi
MTQIDFYTNVTDKLGTACRIIAKAYGLKHRVVICCTDAESARQIDRLLWTTPATGFMPHCAASSPLAAGTPVIIDHGEAEPVHDELLLNLRNEWPPFFARFERLIELVSLDDEDKQHARERYKFYRDRGYEIRTHDLRTTA